MGPLRPARLHRPMRTAPLASTSNSYGLSGAGRLDTTTTGTRGTYLLLRRRRRQYKTRRNHLDDPHDDAHPRLSRPSDLNQHRQRRRSSGRDIRRGEPADLDQPRQPPRLRTFNYKRRRHRRRPEPPDRDGAGTAHSTPSPTPRSASSPTRACPTARAPPPTPGTRWATWRRDTWGQQRHHPAPTDTTAPSARQPYDRTHGSGPERCHLPDIRSRGQRHGRDPDPGRVRRLR